MTTTDLFKLFHPALSPLPGNFGYVQACPTGDAGGLLVLILNSLPVWMIDTQFSE